MNMNFQVDEPIWAACKQMVISRFPEVQQDSPAFWEAIKNIYAGVVDGLKKIGVNNIPIPTDPLAQQPGYQPANGKAVSVTPGVMNPPTDANGQPILDAAFGPEANPMPSMPGRPAPVQRPPIPPGAIVPTPGGGVALPTPGANPSTLSPARGISCPNPNCPYHIPA